MKFIELINRPGAMTFGISILLVLLFVAFVIYSTTEEPVYDNGAEVLHSARLFAGCLGICNIEYHVHIDKIELLSVRLHSGLVTGEDILDTFLPKHRRLLESSVLNHHVLKLHKEENVTALFN